MERTKGTKERKIHVHSSHTTWKISGTLRVGAQVTWNEIKQFYHLEEEWR
jgi:hypothetical protein